jgi:hypothetical protein
MKNSAAIGYALIAGRQIGLTNTQLQDLENMMRAEMDFTTEEQATKVYENN